jgi:S-adenosylmethionine decarboxylase
VLVRERRRSGDPPAEKYRIDCMQLHALDAWVRDPSVLTDAERLKEILHRGASAGGATVVGEEFHVFPNGAVTGVLVLAQSHLSIHTWPEFALANVDLLSYGDVRGQDVLAAVCAGLDVRRSNIVCIPRAVG